MTIVFKENMRIPANVVDELITGVGSDVRQVLNMLSTWKLHNDTMDYEEGKMLCAKLFAFFWAASHVLQHEGK
jgi:replication factor C subunit 1